MSLPNAAKLLHDAGANVKPEQYAERSSKKENSKVLRSVEAK